jgi:hypothetical protein
VLLAPSVILLIFIHCLSSLIGSVTTYPLHCVDATH